MPVPGWKYVIGDRAQSPKHPRPGRSVGVNPESGVGLGPDGRRSVVSRSDLDIDTSGAPVGTGVLDLRLGIEHAFPRIDGEA